MSFIYIVASFLPSPTGYWTLADYPSSEALYEDESFSERGLAALVASKVYYHLQEYNESMVLALGAGDLFKLENGGEYEETIIGMSSNPAAFRLYFETNITLLSFSEMHRHLYFPICCPTTERR